MTSGPAAMQDVETRHPLETLDLCVSAPTVVIPPGACAFLTTGQGSAVSPRVLVTADDGEFRSWFALPGERALEPWRGPQGRLAAALYVAGDVTIAADAALIVTGMPAILLFLRLTIQESGRLEVRTPCHARFGRLEKRNGGTPAWATR